MRGLRKVRDDHTFRVILLPGKKTGHYIEAELEQQELAAIGYFTTQWAFLEHLILFKTAELCPKQKDVQKDAASLAFSKRLSAWRQTIEKFAHTDEEKERLLKLVSKAANLEDRRHKLSHGLWMSDASDPRTLIASSFRSGVAFEVEFDFDGLMKLGHEVGKLCFDLLFPEGKEQALKAMAALAKDGGFVSRSWALSVMDKKAIVKKRPKTGNRPKRKSQS